MKFSEQRQKLTHAELISHLEYDPETGRFRRIRGRIGPAGFPTQGGYISVSIANVTYLAHRAAWLFMTGEWPKGYLDHINRIKSDNRWCNLREVTASENQHNSLTPNASSKVGFRGVRNGNSGRYCAEIRVNGSIIALGSYATAEEAHAAYIGAKLIAFPGLVEAPV